MTPSQKGPVSVCYQAELLWPHAGWQPLGLSTRTPDGSRVLLEIDARTEGSLDSRIVRITKEVYE